MNSLVDPTELLYKRVICSTKEGIHEKMWIGTLRLITDFNIVISEYLEIFKIENNSLIAYNANQKFGDKTIRHSTIGTMPIELLTIEKSTITNDPYNSTKKCY